MVRQMTGVKGFVLHGESSKRLATPRNTGFCVVRGLFGSGMVGLFVLLCVPLFLSCVAMPGLCYFFLVTLRNSSV